MFISPSISRIFLSSLTLKQKDLTISTTKVLSHFYTHYSTRLSTSICMIIWSFPILTIICITWKYSECTYNYFKWKRYTIKKTDPNNISWTTHLISFDPNGSYSLLSVSFVYQLFNSRTNPILRHFKLEFAFAWNSIV